MPKHPDSSENRASQIGGGLSRMIDRASLTGSPTGDVAADSFLRADATAVLMGILFDQRVRAETAFIGPYKLHKRLGHFDMGKLANIDPERFQEVFSASPAVHRFPSVMAQLTLQFARKLEDDYGGAARNLWLSANSPQELDRRVLSFSGFGLGKLSKLRPAMALFRHELPTAVLHK